MPGRKFNGMNYRYGFNGKENDNEVKGDGNQQDYGMRIYDTRLGRFLSIDPLFLSYPWYTPFQFAGNNPIKFIDLDGLEPVEPGKKSGDVQTGTNGNGPAKSWKWDGKQWQDNNTLEEVVVKSDKHKSKNTSNFEKYQAKVFKHEGGFVNDPADPGGATNKGIIFNNFKNWAAKDLGVEPTLDNLKILTNEQAAVLFKKHYWDRILGDEFENGSVAFAIYDWSVTSGDAVRELEKLFAVMTDGITVDSKLKSNEVAILNKVNAEEVFNKIQERRLSYYQGLISRSVNKYLKNHPNATEVELKKNTLLRFKKGWENRVNGINYESN